MPGTKRVRNINSLTNSVINNFSMKLAGTGGSVGNRINNYKLNNFPRFKKYSNNYYFNADRTTNVFKALAHGVFVRTNINILNNNWLNDPKNIKLLYFLTNKESYFIIGLLEKIFALENNFDISKSVDELDQNIINTLGIDNFNKFTNLFNALANSF